MKISTLAKAVSLGIFAVSAISSVHAADTTRVIVSFKPGASVQGKAAVQAARGKVKLDMADMNAMAIEVPVQALKGLQNNPNVEYVEEDVLRFPSSLTFPSAAPYQTGQLVPYGIKNVEADQMPSGDSLTSNRKVCIIDSGYELQHEDLNGNSVTGEYDSGTGWWYTDENSHGTHVAGTIAAINNSGVGVVGVNPNRNLKLHIVKVFGANGWAYSSSLITAANKCKAAGSNIISMSLGGSKFSKTEERAFSDLLTKNGILSIAAAGNDGNTTKSYPASYNTVVSVAAVDHNKQWATFSQYNSAVDISGPGVQVLSTVPMGTGKAASVAIGSTQYTAGIMDGSPNATRTAPLMDFGLGSSTNSAANGKVCLIQRGTVDFATKVTNCQNSGGVGAIVYNNVAGEFSGTLNGAVTTIPSVTVSDTTGSTLLTQLGQSTTVSVGPSNYAYFDGTSMATPHVAAVAALVWSYFPQCSATQIRNAMYNTAEDLGSPGFDNKTGWGHVRAKAAYNYLLNGCNG